MHLRKIKVKTLNECCLATKILKSKFSDIFEDEKILILVTNKTSCVVNQQILLLTNSLSVSFKQCLPNGLKLPIEINTAS